MFKIIRKKSLRARRIGDLATRHLGTTLGGHRDRLVSVFSLDNLLWRSFDIEKGPRNEILLSYFSWGLTTLAKGAHWRRLAGAFVRRIRHCPARLPNDCRSEANALGVVILLSLVGFIWSTALPMGNGCGLHIRSSCAALHRRGRSSPTVLLLLHDIACRLSAMDLFAIPAAVAYFPYRQLKEWPVSMFFSYASL
jgi:hypothetical protein